MHDISIFALFAFFVFIDFRENVFQFCLEHFKQFVGALFIELVLHGKLLGDFIKPVFISPVENNSIHFFAKIYIKDQCWHSFFLFYATVASAL